jgi:hypothetical protein
VAFVTLACVALALVALVFFATGRLAGALFAGARLAEARFAGVRFAVFFVDLALDRRSCAVPCVAATCSSYLQPHATLWWVTRNRALFTCAGGHTHRSLRENWSLSWRSHTVFVARVFA